MRSGPRRVGVLPRNPFTLRVALCMRENTKINSVLARKAHLLHNVNVNYKIRFQGLKARYSRTLFLFCMSAGFLK